MKIKYLGTAAAEGVPALGCQCRVCKKAWDKGGRNMRSRSQALINDELLIEFNSDTVWHTYRYGIDLGKIDNCLITHSHPDHLYPEDIENYRPDFCYGRRNKMNFYSTQYGYDKIKAVTDKPWMQGAVVAHLVKAGERFSVMDGKYSVLPLWANHAAYTSPVIYSIACGGKKMLYAHDTGVFLEKTWEFLKGEGRFDFISLDCTGCLGEGQDWRNGHMSFKTNLEMLERMRSEGLIDDRTVVVVNHFSHNGGQVYDEMLEEAAKHNIIVSYDGLEIEF